MCDKFCRAGADNKTVNDDEVAALLARAKADSERNATVPAAVRGAGRRHVTVQLLRIVPLIVVAVLVLALLRDSLGFG